MANQRKRKVLRAPFIVTVAATATVVGVAVLPGCESVVVRCPASPPEAGSRCSEEGQSCSFGENGCGAPIEYTCRSGAWQDGTATCDRSQPACPASPPEPSSRCGDEGQSCSFGDDGCGGLIEYTCRGGVWQDDTATCNPPPVECPVSLPDEGSPCFERGVQCTYKDSTCEGETVATCDADGTWMVEAQGCDPPPCPEVLPGQGDPCLPPGARCEYVRENACGRDVIVATCGDAGDPRWQVNWLGSVSCNPPSPEMCYGPASEDACMRLAPDCQWAVPGCAGGSEGPPALAEAGCFPSTDCKGDADCPFERRCQDVVINPCYNQACAACGQVVKRCLPPGAEERAPGSDAR